MGTKNASKKKKPPKRKGDVKTASFVILDLDDDTDKQWQSIATVIKRMTNCYWRTWLVAHSLAGNVKRAHEYLVRLKEFYESEHGGEIPSFEVECIPPDIQRKIVREIKRLYPEANNRCMELVVQRLGREMHARKSGKGDTLRWIRILADDGEFPNSAKLQSIPFDRRNSGLIAPLSDEEDFQFFVRLDRIERPDKKYATSTKKIVRLKTRREKQTDILWRIVQGDELEFAGSNLVFSRGKWFANISYWELRSVKPKLNRKRLAVLCPGKRRPWWLRIDGRRHPIGGSGRVVEHARRRFLTGMWSRQETYRPVDGAIKGHGRDRATGDIHLLRTGWHDFVETAIKQLVHDVVAKCVEENCGRLIFLQPVGKKRESRFLHTAGKEPNRTDHTSWAWHRVKTLLTRKCAETGIDFEVREFAGKRTEHMTVG